MAIKVSLNEVVDALEIASDEMSSYVSRVTGAVLTLSHESLRMAEEEQSEELPEWQEQELRQAKAVLDSEDWLQLPSKFDVHEWSIMERFGESLQSAAQRDAVLDSLHGSGAFRMFKSTIRRLGLEDAWYAFRRATMEAMAREWLDEHGLEVGETVRPEPPPPRTPPQRSPEVCDALPPRKHDVKRELTKAQRRRIRQLAGLGWERELARELGVLEAEFARWRSGALTVHDLSERIHQFHQGPQRALFSKYQSDIVEVAVAAAIAHGIITAAEAGADLVEQLGGLIDFARWQADGDGAGDKPDKG